jgi:chromosome segregation ATPase
MSDANVEARLNSIERAITALTATNVRVVEAVETLVRLEERHDATAARLVELATEVKAQRKDLDEIKVAMPGLKEMRKYVVMGIVTGALMIGGALLKLVVIDPQPRPPAYGEVGR